MRICSYNSARLYSSEPLDSITCSSQLMQVSYGRNVTTFSFFKPLIHNLNSPFSGMTWIFFERPKYIYPIVFFWILYTFGASSWAGQGLSLIACNASGRFHQDSIMWTNIYMKLLCYLSSIILRINLKHFINGKNLKLKKN